MPAEAKIFIRAQDLTGPGLAKASASFKQFGQSISRVGKRMSLFITAPLMAAGIMALKTAADFEKQTVAFETMLGSGEKAKKLLPRRFFILL